MYDYKDEKHTVFTDDGQKLLFEVSGIITESFKKAGVVIMEHILNKANGNSTWDVMAAVDRIKELGYITEITKTDIAGQYRTFIKKADFYHI